MVTTSSRHYQLITSCVWHFATGRKGERGRWRKCQLLHSRHRKAKRRQNLELESSYPLLFHGFSPPRLHRLTILILELAVYVRLWRPAQVRMRSEGGQLKAHLLEVAQIAIAASPLPYSTYFSSRKSTLILGYVPLKTKSTMVVYICCYFYKGANLFLPAKNVLAKWLYLVLDKSHSTVTDCSWRLWWWYVLGCKSILNKFASWTISSNCLCRIIIQVLRLAVINANNSLFIKY